MSRWIDADAVIARIAGQMSYEIEVETGNETNCVDLAEELLNDIPSIDIVFCKECGRTAKRSTQYEGKKYCPILVGWVDDDFYCGYGEVRDE